MNKSIAAKRNDAVRTILDQVAISDAQTCLDASKALTVTPKRLMEMREWSDEQLNGGGWTREAFEAAWEARKPMSEASYAVRLAHERTGMRIRQAQDRGAIAPQVAVVITGGHQTMTVEQRKRAPVIDVNADE